MNLFIFFLLALIHSLFTSTLVLNPCDPDYTDLCLINSKIVNKDDLIFSTKLEIVIWFTLISCQTVNLSSSSKITITGSHLNASSIVLTANYNLSIYDSTISTNGTIIKGKGYTSVLLQGFGYAGMGSVCIWWEELIDNSYGPNCAEYIELNHWDMNDTQGSGGIRYWEFGGGRIILKATKYIYFSNSNVTASGYPSVENKTLCENIANQPYSKGGTGGFILIESEEIRYHSQQKTRVEAQGGYYCGFFNF